MRICGVIPMGVFLSGISLGGLGDSVGGLGESSRGLTVWLGMGTFDISPPYVKLYGK